MSLFFASTFSFRGVLTGKPVGVFRFIPSPSPQPPPLRRARRWSNFKYAIVAQHMLPYRMQSLAVGVTTIAQNNFSCCRKTWLLLSFAVYENLVHVEVIIGATYIIRPLLVVLKVARSCFPFCAKQQLPLLLKPFQYGVVWHSLTIPCLLRGHEIDVSVTASSSPLVDVSSMFGSCWIENGTSDNRKCLFFNEIINNYSPK